MDPTLIINFKYEDNTYVLSSKIWNILLFPLIKNKNFSNQEKFLFLIYINNKRLKRRGMIRKIMN